MPSGNNHSYNNNLLDEHVNTELMRVCKCMLPYMDQSVQKKMAITIKLFELISVMNLYADETIAPPITLTRGDDWEKHLLLDIRSQLNPEKAYLVDAALKVSDLKKIMELKNSLDSIPNTSSDTPTEPTPPTSTNTSNPSDVIDKFSPFLDDNQKQMLKLFSTFMK